MKIFSEDNMTPYRYLKKHGLKHAVYTLFNVKIYNLLIRVIKCIFKNNKLKNIIVIESHNDFDCNGGALYDYLIKKGYNKKYKIVWLLRFPELCPKKLPQNVKCVPFYKKSILKEYYMYNAKFITFDAVLPPKLRKEQTMIYLTHGGCTFKNTLGEIVIPEFVDYILTSSKEYAPYECKNFSIPYPNNRMIDIGFPYNDALFNCVENEVSKITPHKFNKVILWMPTFRIGDWGKVDSNAVQPLGIPLIETNKSYLELNEVLKKYDSLLIIKIHPRQKLDGFALESKSNIKVITALDAKRLDIDNYRLMKYCDALISDYSSSAYSYILLDRPIGFLLSDLEDYTRGFSVENYEDFLPGEHIYNIEQFKAFITDVVSDNDKYKTERNKLCDWLYKYKDGNACKRLVEFMNL